MANAILWDANPTAEVIMAVASGPLRNLHDATVAVSSECENGTDRKQEATFELNIHDFAAAPDAGGYFELHICYQLDGTYYADGEMGDMDDPNLGADTLVGVFPIRNSDEPQRRQLVGLRIEPFDFKCAVINRCGQAIQDGDGSFLKIYRYSSEVQ